LPEFAYPVVDGYAESEYEDDEDDEGDEDVGADPEYGEPACGAVPWKGEPEYAESR
jgi:hypothetical protein